VTVPSSTYRGNDVPLIGSYFCRTWRTERSALLPDCLIGGYAPHERT